MQIKNRFYLDYKFFNSLFGGLSIGSVFTIYAPLPPSLFSIGGVVLAFGIMVVAKAYSKLMSIRYFYHINWIVEIVVLLMAVGFLLAPYDYKTALWIYAGYQICFIFGVYLVRAETLFLQKRKLLGLLDTIKQKGYLLGLLLSFVFYKSLEFLFGIDKPQIQVFHLHWLLVIVQIATLIMLYKAFNDRLKPSCNQKALQ